MHMRDRRILSRMDGTKIIRQPLKHRPEKGFPV